MKRSKLNLKLNHPVNFRTNEDLYTDFTKKCNACGQYNQERLNILIAADLGKTLTYITKSEKHTLFESNDNISSPEDAPGANTGI